MSIKDFQAKRLRTGVIIGSGSGDGSSPHTVIYSASIATNFAGGISDSNMLANTGRDVGLFVSGSVGSREAYVAGTSAAKHVGGTSVFSGDLHVSGNITTGTGVPVGGGLTTGSFNVPSPSEFVTTASVSIAGTQGFLYTADSVGTDTYFYVSGSRTPSGSADRHTAQNPAVSVFGGDLVVSGTLYAERQVIEVDQRSTGSLMISGSLFVSRSADVNQGMTVNASQGSFAETANKFIVKTVDGDALTINNGTQNVIINDAGSANIDFIVESSGEDKAIWLDSDQNTLYINEGGTGFATIIKTTHGEALEVGINGIVANQGGSGNHDFRAESLNKPGAILVDSQTDQVILGTEGLTAATAGGNSTAIGQDVSVYLSGTVGGHGGSSPATIVAAGDMVVSGALHLSGNISMGGGGVSGDETTQFYAERGVNFQLSYPDDDVSAWFGIQNYAGTYQHLFYDHGLVHLNYSRAASGDLSVRGSSDYGLIFTDAGENAVTLGAALDASPSWGDFKVDDVGPDVKIVLSGTVGGKGGTTRNTTLNAGDIVISGSTYTNTLQALAGNLNIKATDSNSDIIFTVDEGGVDIVAMTIDGSSNGSTLFSPQSGGTVTVNDGNTDGKTSITGDGKILQYHHNNFSYTEPQVAFYRSRGNESAPTAVNLDDDLGSISWLAYQGSGYQTSAQIQALADGGVGSTDTPGRIEFKTAPDGSSTLTSRMTIKNDGKVGVGTQNPYEILDVRGNQLITGFVSASMGLSGSLTRLVDGTSYLRAGSGINITSASNGAVTITGTAVSAEWTDTGAILHPNEGAGESVGIGSAGNDRKVFPIYLGEGATGYMIATSGFVTASMGLSGSLTRLTDGTSAFIAGSGINITSQSNGAVTITGTAVSSEWTDEGSILRPNDGVADAVGIGGTGTNRKLYQVYIGENNPGSGDTTLQVNGFVTASLGYSGSLTRLVDGTSYLRAGSGINIVSQSNGAITLSTTGAGTVTSGSFNVPAPGKFATTASISVAGGLGFAHASDVGREDTYFFVSGAFDNGGSGGKNKNGVSVFGGDTVISGALYVGAQEEVKFTQAANVFNDNGVNTDFRVESQNNDHMFHVDASTSRIGMGSIAGTGPDTTLHLKESAPTFRIQRDNNANDSTIEFAGAAGVRANMVHLGGVSSNDFVISAWNENTSAVEQILNFTDQRKVIFLSSSGVNPASMQPNLSTDLSFFVSGTIGGKDGILGGVSVFGGDVVVSGSVTGGSTGLTLGANNSDVYLAEGADLFVPTYIKHRNDTNTWIQFNNDRIRLNTDGGTRADITDEQVLFLSGGSVHSTNEAAGLDVKFYVSGSVDSEGTGIRGTSLFGGDVKISGSLGVNTVVVTSDGRVGIGAGITAPATKLEVGGNITLGEYLYHRNDPDTYLRFQDNSIQLRGGNRNFLHYENQALVLNGDKSSISTAIYTENKLAIAAVTPAMGSPDPDRVLILSGGASESHNESVAGDVSFYVSGSATTRNSEPNDDRIGASLFGGDVAVSGSMLISGSLHNIKNPHTKFRFDHMGPGSLRIEGANTGGTDGVQLFTYEPHGTPPSIGINNDGHQLGVLIKANNKMSFVAVPNGATDQYVVINSDNAGEAGTDTALYVSGAVGALGLPDGHAAKRGIATFGGDVVISGSLLAGRQVHKTRLAWTTSITNNNPRFPVIDGIGTTTTTPTVQNYFSVIGSGSLRSLDLWCNETSVAKAVVTLFRNHDTIPTAHITGSFVNTPPIIGDGNKGHLFIDFNRHANFITGSNSFDPGDVISVGLSKLAGTTFTGVYGTLYYAEDGIDTGIGERPAGSPGDF